MKTNSDEFQTTTAARAMICERCGTAFGCDLGGACWCMDEAFRVPMPEEGSGADCLCPTCLWALVQDAEAKGHSHRTQ